MKTIIENPVQYLNCDTKNYSMLLSFTNIVRMVTESRSFVDINSLGEYFRHEVISDNEVLVYQISLRTPKNDEVFIDPTRVILRVCK